MMKASKNGPQQHHQSWPSRRGGFLSRASRRTGIVGPHPALQVDNLKTTSVASWPGRVKVLPSNTQMDQAVGEPSVAKRFVNSKAGTAFPMTANFVDRFIGQTIMTLVAIVYRGVCLTRQIVIGCVQQVRTSCRYVGAGIGLAMVFFGRRVVDKHKFQLTG